MDYLYALQCVRESSPDIVNYLFVVISEVLPKLLMVFAAIIYWCINKTEGATILLGYSTSYGINQTIKNIACVYRPWIQDSRLHVAPQAAKSATGYSFPSGHTVGVAAICGEVAVWLRKKIWVLVLSIITIVFVAFSRNWLGAHTMKDVLTAILVASITIIIINILKYFIARKPEKDTLVMIFGILLMVVITLILQLKKYPMDYDADGKLLCDPLLMLTDCYTALGLVCGGLLGWWLERHTVKFTTETSKKNLIIRGLVGFASFGILYFLLDIAFDSLEKVTIYLRNPGHMIKYFMLFLYILYIYPLIFNFIQKKSNGR